MAICGKMSKTSQKLKIQMHIWEWFELQIAFQEHSINCKVFHKFLTHFFSGLGLLMTPKAI